MHESGPGCGFPQSVSQRSSARSHTHPMNRLKDNGITHPNKRTSFQNTCPRRAPRPSSVAAPSVAMTPATVSRHQKVLPLHLHRRQCRRRGRSQGVRRLRRWVWMLVERSVRLDIASRREKPFWLYVWAKVGDYVLRREESDTKRASEREGRNGSGTMKFPSWSQVLKDAFREDRSGIAEL